MTTSITSILEGKLLGKTVRISFVDENTVEQFITGEVIGVDVLTSITGVWLELKGELVPRFLPYAQEFEVE